MRQRWRGRADARRLLSELPDALGRLAADLRGGATVRAGLEAWAAGGGLLAERAADVLSLIDGGAALPGALAAWTAPGTPPELRAVGAALEVASVAGGRAAAALDGLAASLRDAADVRAEARSLSAQARLSAAVVAAAPLATLSLSALSDRRLPAALIETPPGRACLAAGLALEAAGGLAMARALRAPA